MVSAEVVHGHTMSQEQFSKYRPCSCHAIGHPRALDSLIGGQHLPHAEPGQRRVSSKPRTQLPTTGFVHRILEVNALVGPGSLIPQTKSQGRWQAGSGPTRPERAQRGPGARPGAGLLPRLLLPPGPAGEPEAGTILI